MTTQQYQYFLARPVIDQGVRVIVEGESWWQLAACRGMDTEIFFYKDTYAARAKSICKGCPVQVECLEEVMRTEPADHRHGVWGGLSSGERRMLARKARLLEQEHANERAQGLKPEEFEYGARRKSVPEPRRSSRSS